ncbi:SRPBCC domain-containing protein [Neotabrizicola shimadae]|uniref:SRPBCC domain-containing protein n=1 Tax=Neotabrizicola shimadae TaxID=2807096 RepID=A0A8G1EED4_9RHOB|nr:SRPBCC domain-containing protein [Neotabrizicola shimadae]QYZ71201.1 SRPBCC domain-containing protein [Neotabrizicola shimadae]
MTPQTLTITRLIPAPPEKVWRCWTDPALLPRWFGPQGFTCHTKEIDLREGGVWRFDMIGPDGKVWANRHRHTRWDPPKRIEFIMDGDVEDGTSKQVTVTLAPEAGGTRITQVMVFSDPADFAMAKQIGAEALGQTTLAKLEALAVTL